jgi:hypothetical protein
MFNANVNFGDVAVGSTVTFGVTVSNTGTAPLTVQQDSLTGAGFTTNGIGQGVTLNPGQYTTLAVTFNPSNSGQAKGMVTLTNNTTEPTINVPLAGNGIVATHSTTLNWDASQTGVVGYNVYRTPAANEAWQKLNSSPVIANAYTDWDVQGGGAYLFVVTAVSPTNLESAFSNATVISVPTP